MQKIVPHLWYDKEAKEAASFYVNLFENSKILSSTIIEDTPSGDAENISFMLAGQYFQAISAGPFFKLNPSISLMVACDSVEEVNSKWKALSEGGRELMPLAEYPFSKWYCWVEDRYGLSWQLMFTDNAKNLQKITPNFLFSNEVCGRAEEAIKYYTDVFENSTISNMSYYADGEAEIPDAKINYGAFKLEGFELSAMDNGYPSDFNFNEAFSLTINCEDQQEIDYFWEKLSAAPEAEACGWVKDKFGVSWQIVPTIMFDMMQSGTGEQMNRVTEAFMSMKKFDIEALKRAFEGASVNDK